MRTVVARSKFPSQNYKTPHVRTMVMGSAARSASAERLKRGIDGVAATWTTVLKSPIGRQSPWHNQGNGTTSGHDFESICDASETIAKLMPGLDNLASESGFMSSWAAFSDSWPGSSYPWGVKVASDMKRFRKNGHHTVDMMTLRNHTWTC